MIYKVDGDFDRAKGMEVTETILQRYPNKGDFDAIYYMNDEMALGGLQAIEDSGRLGRVHHHLRGRRSRGPVPRPVKLGKINYEVMFKPTSRRGYVEIAYKIAKARLWTTPTSTTRAPRSRSPRRTTASLGSAPPAT